MRRPVKVPFWSRLHDAVLRPVAPLVLVACATVILVPAIIANWTRTNVYNTDRFADNAVAALNQDVVRDALVREIVDEIVTAGGPEVLTVRPLVEFVTATVVDSLTFQEIFRDSVVQMHRQVFGEGGTPSVALTLVDAIIVVTAYLEQAYPEVGGQIPRDLGASFIQIRDRDLAVEVVAFGDSITFLAIVLPAVVALLYVLAVVISRDRRLTLTYIGLGYLAVALLLVLGRDYARDIVLGAGFGDAAVGRAIWDVYTRSLLGWAGLAGGFGLLLVVAVRGANRPEPRRQLEMVSRAFAYRPPSAWGGVVRAASFAVVGILVVLQRDMVIELAVLLVAAYLVYYGLSELIWLAVGSPEPVERARVPPRFRVAPSRRLAMRAGAAAVLLVATAGGIFLGYRAVETTGGQVLARPPVEACNGFAQLCDRRLDHVVFLGSHNSMAAASEPGWYFPEHLTSIPSQLEAGVRLLLIDTYYGYDTGNGVRTADRDIVAEALSPEDYSEQVLDAARRIAGVMGGAEREGPPGTYLCHAFCELGAKPLTLALRQIDHFLEENPHEVVILAIQDQITPEDTAKAFIASGLVRRVYHLQDGEPLPTLRQMIERDERVLVFADNDASGVDWYYQAFDYIHDTSFRVERASDFSCDLARGAPDHPFFALNHWVKEPFPSTLTASRINSFDFLLHRVSECHRERQTKVNFIVVNFVEVGEALQVVDYLNGVGQRPRPDE